MGGENVFNEMDSIFLTRLDLLRALVNEPLSITSSFRSEDYNSSVGGSKTSYHLKGRAVDLKCNDGVSRRKITQSALKLGLSVGVAKNFIHIDNRTNQIVFTY
tara:strand:- start:52 stop:360 length:309 start_codon:yes stop_codon:yes gene_type:complete